MPSRSLRLASTILLALALGCATAAPGTHTPIDLITLEQIQQYHFRNAYEAVQTLHAGWLLTRGPGSVNMVSQVMVYRDGVRLGGVEALREIEIGDVKYIRHYDGIAATARWGLDHDQGAIVVSTHPL